jgi:hypothetical protein
VSEAAGSGTVLFGEVDVTPGTEGHDFRGHSAIIARSPTTATDHILGCGREVAAIEPDPQDDTNGVHDEP